MTDAKWKIWRRRNQFIISELIGTLSACSYLDDFNKFMTNLAQTRAIHAMSSQRLPRNGGDWNGLICSS